MNPQIELHNLCWQVDQKTILADVSFSVFESEFVGIIGPNGAGKSSILRCIYGNNDITSGEILVKNKCVKNYPRRELAQKIAVVLQEPSTHFELTVYDVIAMGLTPRKALLSFNSKQDEQDIICAATQVEIENKLHQQFSSLSGGEKQRAIIARAMVQKPDILLMDEPTNHLDIKHQIEVLDLAKQLGVTVLVSIHDLNLAAAYCDRLLLLDEGKLVADGKVEDVLSEKLISQVFKVNTKVDRHPLNSKIRVSFDLHSSVQESLSKNTREVDLR